MAFRADLRPKSRGRGTRLSAGPRGAALGGSPGGSVRGRAASVRGDRIRRRAARSPRSFKMERVAGGCVCVPRGSPVRPLVPPCKPRALLPGGAGAVHLDARPGREEARPGPAPGTLCLGSVRRPGGVLGCGYRPQSCVSRRYTLSSFLSFCTCLKYVLIQTFNRSFLSLLSLPLFPFLNGKECLEGLLAGRLPLQSVDASRGIESSTSQAHFAHRAIVGILTQSCYTF